MLSQGEQNKLIKLMEKISFPTPISVFKAWCKVFGVICTEVAVVKNGKNGPEVFLTYRNDEFFNGWHIPGAVHLPNENIDSTLKRVLRTEIKMRVNKPRFFGYFERMKGNGTNQSKRGYELSTFFTCRLMGKAAESDNEKFFPLNNLPKNTMTAHLPILRKMRISLGGE